MSKVEEGNYEVENEHEVEEEDDNTPLDKETIEKFKNLNVDQSAFTAQTGTKSKKKKVKQTKTNKKGEDFIDYANKHGINVSLKYGEKSPEKKEAKEEKKYTKPDVTSQNKPTEGNYSNQDQANPNKPKTFNKKKNYYNKNKYPNNKTTFNNKFDPMNANSFNPYILNPTSPYNNMMYYGQMQGAPQNMNFHKEEHYVPKGIKESLEYYLSLENLNKDTYVRERMDKNGCVIASEILKFNNMKKLNADLDKIREVISKGDCQVEESTVEGEVAFRNKNWENIKNQLLSIEEIESRKQSKKAPINYNYVTLQNNFFMPMMPYDQNMMQQQMSNQMQFMMPYGMNMMNPNANQDHNTNN